MKNPLRKFENLHILLWLLKDMSWLMMWRDFGIFMIFPTMVCAIFIAYKSYNNKSDFFHNLAVVFWISANSFWMLSEFFAQDHLKIYAAIPFAIGLFIMFYYYYKTLFNK